MLAVQRPSMGSRKPRNLEMPFGYSFEDNGSNYPFPSPTAPALGPSLLDDNEFKFLDNFLEGVSSDQFNYDIFNLNDEQNLGNGWENLTSTFMETPSTYGQPSQVASQNGLAGINFGQMNTQIASDPSMITPASVETIQAAVQLQNVPNRRPDMVDESLLRGRETQFLPINGSERIQLMSQSTSGLQPFFQSRANGQSFVGEPTHADLVFSDHTVGGMPRNPRVNPRVDIRWGSDSTFTTPQGFITTSGQENVSATEKYNVRAVGISLSLPQNSNSAGIICPRSPPFRKGSVSHQRLNSTGHIYAEDDQNLESNKRRKIESQDEDDDDDYQPLSSTNKTVAIRRKVSPRDLIDPSALGYEPGQEPGQKRRRSTIGAAAKTTRENLTEEQKRENHIKSEQKRRTLIREGFEDLNELVPGIQGSGFSKSAVLVQTADWLEQLLLGNRVLKSRIDLIKGNK